MNSADLSATHRQHAVACNNLAWDLSERPQRSPAQDAEMLHAAHAAAFHWSKVGTAQHAARAEMLLAHVHALLGQAVTAMAYARSSHAWLLAHQPPDWEAAFSWAVLAHAAAMAGDHALHRSAHAQGFHGGAAIADATDREIFQRFFARVPAPT